MFKTVKKLATYTILVGIGFYVGSTPGCAEKVKANTQKYVIPPIKNVMNKSIDYACDRIQEKIKEDNGLVQEPNDPNVLENKVMDNYKR